MTRFNVPPNESSKKRGIKGRILRLQSIFGPYHTVEDPTSSIDTQDLGPKSNINDQNHQESTTIEKQFKMPIFSRKPSPTPPTSTPTTREPSLQDLQASLDDLMNEFNSLKTTPHPNKDRVAIFQRIISLKTDIRRRKLRWAGQTNTIDSDALVELKSWLEDLESEHKALVGRPHKPKDANDLLQMMEVLEVQIDRLERMVVRSEPTSCAGSGNDPPPPYQP
jgi:hypothetical protein